MNPAITAIVARSDRVNQHLDTWLAGGVDDGAEQSWRANPFAVVGYQDRVSPLERRRQLGVQPGLVDRPGSGRVSRSRRGSFAVDVGLEHVRCISP